ncbi:unnamed protein product [Gongylonema pulchrum]|uniref:ANK_REP_REGION domain-containing protein n=1 Tax=Gongylonema pulchrum TaxID=637853 RepID=A0A183D7G7_9BILA|nr:unnamed protein product [Gongylonema pulchrum]
MTLTKVGTRLVVHEDLSKYRVPDLSEQKNAGYDGRMEWRQTTAMLIAINRFRTAVLNFNVDAVRKTLRDLQDVTTAGFSHFSNALLLCKKRIGQIGRLLTLLFNRSSAEPTKEALLTAICIGSRPLVEFILSLFYEFPGEERNGQWQVCFRKTKGMP